MDVRPSPEINDSSKFFLQTGSEKFAELCLQKKHIWMGIVNLTPDSFSDGSKYNSIENAISRSLKLVEHGASIIDLGGVSTRPSYVYNSNQSYNLNPSEELERVYNIIQAIKVRLPKNILISIDTFSPIVAETLAKEGLIDIINDVFSGKNEENTQGKTKNTALVAAQYKLAYIVMHMKGTPETMQLNPSYTNIEEEVFNFLQKKINFAKNHGVSEVCIDPGIGFGKSLQHNLILTSDIFIQQLNTLNVPILIGLSRKSFIAQLYPELTTPNLRDPISKKLELQCFNFGAKIIRSHTMPSETIIEQEHL